MALYARFFSDVDHETDFSTAGGVLVDLGFCDRDDDHFVFNQDVLNGDQSRTMDIQTVSAGTSDEEAFFRCRK